MAAATQSKWAVPLGGPPISPDDLTAFFDSHFSPEAVANFGQTFRNPAAFQQTHQQPGPHDGAEEDGLGYYDDGVKRTLTDAQVKMFRQSELRQLRQNRGTGPNSRSTTFQIEAANDANQSQPCSLPLPARGKSKKKKKKKRAGNKPHYEPKPDLRKRTWDVVEPGLDTLDYN